MQITLSIFFTDQEASRESSCPASSRSSAAAATAPAEHGKLLRLLRGWEQPVPDGRRLCSRPKLWGLLSELWTVSVVGPSLKKVVGKKVVPYFKEKIKTSYQLEKLCDSSCFLSCDRFLRNLGQDMFCDGIWTLDS